MKEQWKLPGPGRCPVSAEARGGRRGEVAQVSFQGAQLVCEMSVFKVPGHLEDIAMYSTYLISLIYCWQGRSHATPEHLPLQDGKDEHQQHTRAAAGNKGVE